VYAMREDELVVLPQRAFFCLLCGQRKRHLGGYFCVRCLREARREIHTAIAAAKAGLTASLSEP
ncbi:MAG: hypothetical protein M5U25_11415, partial [Planctomycetota bacterium]|nr:hypothetical protein [Planctomycetota bacterium]